MAGWPSACAIPWVPARRSGVRRHWSAPFSVLSSCSRSAFTIGRFEPPSSRNKMVDLVTRDKWDAAAKSFDLLASGDERRFAEVKRRFFAGIAGKTLLVAAG